MKNTEKSPEGRFASWRWWSVARWLLLAQAVFNIMTNAYYLQLLEPVLPRKALLLVSIGAAAVAIIVDRLGLPTDWRAVASWLRRYAVPFVLLLILCLAFALRLGGVGYGLPQSYVSDEYDIVHSYLKMLKRGDFDPHWWIHPSLQAYVNVVVYLIVFLVEVPTGRWQSIQELVEEDFLFWGRFGAGVLPGTITVLVTYFLGRRMFGKGVGLISAALMAVSPAAIEWSQYNKPDPLLALMVPLSLLLILYYLDTGGKRLAFACGITFGLTAAAKYNGGFVFLPFLVAVALRHRSRLLKSWDLYLGAAGSVLGFFIGCPYFLSDFPVFVDHVANALYNYGYAGWPGADGVDNWAFHARYAIAFGMGGVAFVATLVGLGIALQRFSGRIAVFLTFPVLYYAYYSSQTINIPGNIVCTYPFFFILAGLAFRETAALAQRLPQRKLTPLLEHSILAGLVLLALGSPLSNAISRNHERNLPDTGNIARVWIEARFPPGTHFAVERQTPVIDRQRYQVTMEARIINRAVRDYRSEGVQYLIVSSALYDRYGPEHRQTKAYQRLFAICRLLKEFAPEDGAVVGPAIRILEVPDESDAAAEPASESNSTSPISR